MTICRDFEADPLRLLIVEDEPVLASALGELLGRDPRLTVVGLAHGVRNAVQALRTLPVELALVDVRLGHENGFAVIDAIRQWDPEVAAVVMSGLDPSELARDVAAGGVAAVLQKHELIDGGRDVLLSAFVRSRPAVPGAQRSG